MFSLCALRRRPGVAAPGVRVVVIVASVGNSNDQSALSLSSPIIDPGAKYPETATTLDKFVERFGESKRRWGRIDC